MRIPAMKKLLQLRNLENELAYRKSCAKGICKTFEEEEIEEEVLEEVFEEEVLEEVFEESGSKYKFLRSGIFEGDQ
jgi:hypothetical protein